MRIYSFLFILFVCLCSPGVVWSQIDEIFEINLKESSYREFTFKEAHLDNPRDNKITLKIRNADPVKLGSLITLKLKKDFLLKNKAVVGCVSGCEVFKKIPVPFKNSDDLTISISDLLKPKMQDKVSEFSVTFYAQGGALKGTLNFALILDMVPPSKIEYSEDKTTREIDKRLREIQEKDSITEEITLFNPGDDTITVAAKKRVGQRSAIRIVELEIPPRRSAPLAIKFIAPAYKTNKANEQGENLWAEEMVLSVDELIESNRSDPERELTLKLSAAVVQEPQPIPLWVWLLGGLLVLTIASGLSIYYLFKDRDHYKKKSEEYQETLKDLNLLTGEKQIQIDGERLEKIKAGLVGKGVAEQKEVLEEERKKLAEIIGIEIAPDPENFSEQLLQGAKQLMEQYYQQKKRNEYSQSVLSAMGIDETVKISNEERQAKLELLKTILAIPQRIQEVAAIEPVDFKSAAELEPFLEVLKSRLVKKIGDYYPEPFQQTYRLLNYLREDIKKTLDEIPNRRESPFAPKLESILGTTPRIGLNGSVQLFQSQSGLLKAMGAENLPELFSLNSNQEFFKRVFVRHLEANLVDPLTMLYHYAHLKLESPVQVDVESCLNETGIPVERIKQWYHQMEDVLKMHWGIHLLERIELGVTPFNAQLHDTAHYPEITRVGGNQFNALLNVEPGVIFDLVEAGYTFQNEAAGVQTIKKPKVLFQSYAS